MSKLHIFPLLIALSLTLSACGGTEAASSGEEPGPSTAEHTERSTDPSDDRSADRRGEDRSGGRSDDRRARGGQGEKIQAAVLELSGDEGSGFSGVCAVGRKDVEVEGTVPRSLDLDLDGEPLRCEIENTGASSLKADLSVGNSHYTQQTSTRGATLNFALSGDGYTSSTSSVTAVESETADAISNASSHVEAGPSDDG